MTKKKLLNDEMNQPALSNYFSSIANIKVGAAHETFNAATHYIFCADQTFEIIKSNKFAKLI